jgi:putative ABC transport system permease protein
MKAIGFSDFFVMIFVLIESMLVAVVGGGIGLGLAKLITLGGDPTGGFLPIFHMPVSAFPWGMGAALAVGVISALWPAKVAMRLRVVDALRRV